VSDQSRDRIEGKVDEMKGRSKSAIGELTDDERLKGEGALDKAKGKFKQGLADAKDAVDAAVKRNTDD
jgi:uncharacterized protein YjbJ (UPF0337 family)